MSKNITLCIVGAGSSYTPEIVGGIIANSGAEIPITAVRLMDIDEERLSIMAGLAERMLRHADSDITLQNGTDLDAMLEGANFVVTQIRVGGMPARYLDESIPLKYDVIGQETTGPGGMFKALRTIPSMLHIARRVMAICPDAFILNYTNPSGIITEAVTKHTDAKIIGLCSGIPGMRQKLAKQLAEPYPDLNSYSVGLNHLGFIHRMISGGQDVTTEAIEYLCRTQDPETEGERITTQLIQFLNAVPIAYVHYYLHRRECLAHAKEADETRAQQIMKIEGDIFKEAALPETVSRPAASDKRGGGGYADVTFGVMAAIHNNTGAEIAASVPNCGTITGIEDDAAVEAICRMDANGATPLPVGEIPLAYRGLIMAVKVYETLTVAAAVAKSRTLAVKALMNHPLVGDLHIAEPLVDEMLKAHGLEFD